MNELLNVTINENHIDGNGCNITTRTPKCTGKGQQYFINKFLTA